METVLTQEIKDLKEKTFGQNATLNKIIDTVLIEQGTQTPINCVFETLFRINFINAHSIGIKGSNNCFSVQDKLDALDLTVADIDKFYTQIAQLTKQN